MPPVVIYTKSWCPYCTAAKNLLAKKGVAFTEHEISGKPELADEMVRLSGRRTVPQIFIGDTHVGGSDDLHEADRRGELDRLLAA